MKRWLGVAVVVSVLGGAAQAAPCDNALNPVKAWTWRYQTAPKKAGEAVSRYEVRRTPGEATYQDEVLNGSKNPIAFKYKCVQGGHVNISVPQMPGTTITRLVAKGLTTPPQSAWKPGFAWTYNLALEGRRGVLGGSGAFDSAYRVVGRESVTVPAGTFDAWKVVADNTALAKLGAITLFNQRSTSAAWYAEGVGLIKSDDQRGLTELLNIEKGE